MEGFLMNEQNIEPVTGRKVWCGYEMLETKDWIYYLDEVELRAIDESIQKLKTTDLPLESTVIGHVAHPVLKQMAKKWLDELNAGKGFIFARGFDAAGYSKEDAARGYWAIGLHMGSATPQSRGGGYLGHIKDVQAENPGKKLRLYQTTKGQDFHVDGSDIVGLLCLNRAKRGGLSQIVSSMTVYNEIVAKRPDLVPLMFQPVYWDLGNDAKPGDPPYVSIPICSNVNGHLRFFYIGWYIRDAQRYPEVPRLTEAQNDMLELIEAAANDPKNYLDMDFQVGDMQFLKNSNILHSRTEYEDFEEPEKKRHLLRLWLTAEEFEDGDAVIRKGYSENPE
jgi:hypothetical protein